MKNDFVINPDEKFFPSADEWMWSYCTFLGKFVDSRGENWDLGILIEGDIEGQWSAACVYGNEPGNYISGARFMYYNKDGEARDVIDKGFDHIKEMVRRARILNLIE